MKFSKNLTLNRFKPEKISSRHKTPYKQITIISTSSVIHADAVSRLVMDFSENQAMFPKSCQWKMRTADNRCFLFKNSLLVSLLFDLNVSSRHAALLRHSCCLDCLVCVVKHASDFLLEGCWFGRP